MKMTEIILAVITPFALHIDRSSFEICASLMLTTPPPT